MADAHVTARKKNVRKKMTAHEDNQEFTEEMAVANV